jgi:hypothetical protein
MRERFMEFRFQYYTLLLGMQQVIIFERNFNFQWSNDHRLEQINLLQRRGIIYTKYYADSKSEDIANQ